MSHVDMCEHGFPIGECLTPNCDNPLDRAIAAADQRQQRHDEFEADPVNQARFNLPCKHCGEPANVGHHDDCRIEPFQIWRMADVEDGEVDYTLMGATTTEHNLKLFKGSGLFKDIEKVLDINGLTWGTAKRIQRLLNEMERD